MQNLHEPVVLATPDQVQEEYQLPERDLKVDLQLPLHANLWADERNPAETVFGLSLTRHPVDPLRPLRELADLVAIHM